MNKTGKQALIAAMLSAGVVAPHLGGRKALLIPYSPFEPKPQRAEPRDRTGQDERRGRVQARKKRRGW